MRALITGAGGQLATYLAKDLAGDGLVALTHAQLDVVDEPAVRQVMDDIRPDVVINTAAYHDVDACEHDVERSFRVNAEGPLMLARACAEFGGALVHVSTDYVFGGQTERTPLGEQVMPFPVNVYGASKLAGEHLIRTALARHIIVRTCGLYGARDRGKDSNFVLTMLRLGREQGQARVVNDQTCTPSYAGDVARGVISLIEADVSGTFNVVNDGACTWYEFAREIFSAALPEVVVEPVTSREFPRPAARPAYSVLDTAAFVAASGASLPPWQHGVQSYLTELGTHGPHPAA